MLKSSSDLVVLAKSATENNTEKHGELKNRGNRDPSWRRRAPPTAMSRDEIKVLVGGSILAPALV